MNNNVLNNIAAKIKVSYNLIAGNKWKYTSFDNCTYKIIESYELFPEKYFRYEHTYAEPRDLYYYRESKIIRILEKVLVWPHYSIVAIDNKTLIKESTLSNYRINNIIHNNLLRSFPIHAECEPCVIIEQGSFNNYYHWYIDTLPRLFGLHHPGIKNKKRIKLFITEKLNRQELQIVRNLIPQNTEIVQISPYTRIMAERYIHLPYLSSEWEGYLPREYISFYREKVFSLFNINPANDVSEEKIFISRRLANCRRMLNEDEVYSELIKYGFKRYNLETLPIREQIRLFSRAKLIVGQHGAGLTNMIYSKNASIVEIFSTNYPGIHHYRMLAAAVGNNYINVFSEKKFRKHEMQIPWKMTFSRDLVDSDIRVDVSELLSVIKKMEMITT